MLKDYYCLCGALDCSHCHPGCNEATECVCCGNAVLKRDADNEGRCEDCQHLNLCGYCNEWIDGKLDDDGVCPECIKREQLEQKGA